MYEKWKKEFFEWKDEIEVKFNNLSEKNTKLEKKFEDHLEDDSEEIRNELARQVDLIGENIEQITDIRKQNDARFVDILVPLTHRFVMFYRVLHELMNILHEYACNEISEIMPELKEKLDFKSIHNDPILKKCQEVFKEMEKQAEKKEIIEVYEGEYEAVIDKITGVTNYLKKVSKCEFCNGVGFFEKEGYKTVDCVHCKGTGLVKDSGGEKDVSEVDETGGATPTRNVEFDTSSLLGDDSKPPESKHTCSFCGRNLILYKQEWICGHGCIKHAILPKGTGPEKEGGMPYFRINCPFCEGHSVSDVIDSIKEVDGQWECSNGHQFVVKYLGKIE